MSKSAQVLLLTGDPHTREVAARLRAEGIDAVVADSYVGARLALERDQQWVAVLDGELPYDEMAQICGLLRERYAVPTLMLVPPGVERTPGIEVDERVSKPVKLDELVLRVKALMVRAGYELPSRPDIWPITTNGDGSSSDNLRKGKIVAVFSAKGGVGKTTIAVNLAVGLAHFYQRKTLLIDADLWFGDVGVLLNIFSRQSLFELCAEGDIDLEMLHQTVVRHRSGVSVLLRPPDPMVVEKIGPSCMAKVLRMSKLLFEHIVVDTHPSFDETNLQILDIADQILLVTTPEMSAVHNTVRFLEIADSLDYASKLLLLVNRANSGIDMEALQESLGIPVAGQIVSAGRLVVKAATHGTPIFMKDPGEEEQVTRDLVHVVELVAGRARPQSASTDTRRLFPFFRKAAR